MSLRHEYKYRISAAQSALLANKAAALMLRDPHAGPDGSYLVRSLYLDDALDTCLWDNLAGGEPRAKYRLRYYGDDLSTLRLEKKSKRRGLGVKEHCLLTPEEGRALLRGEFPAVENCEPLKQRLLTEAAMYGLQPKIIVTYAREAMVYPGGNVRITFDRALTSSGELDRFFSGDYAQRPVFALGESILEVKWDELFSRHITEVLQTDRLNQTAFSKYYWCRKLHL